MIAPFRSNADKEPEYPLPLFDRARPSLPPPAHRSAPRGERMFIDFHAKNPSVLDEVIRLARRMRERGVRFGSIDGIWEEMRRTENVQACGDLAGFRLNNVYAAYYARLAIFRAPDLDGFFELRRQRVPFDPSKVTP